MDDLSVPHKSDQKIRTKYHLHRPGVDAFNIAKLGTKDNQKPQKAIILSREVWREEFNQLKFR